MFNRFLLAACISIVVALIFYFFYWNRFLAFFIGRAIRLLYWNQEASSIWVKIGSIHFSLLAGRILLKDVRYHSSNQTLKIVKAQIQWRYWIRRPTSEEDLYTPKDEEAKFAVGLWNCRVHVSLQGLEWKIYNKTSAYDAIVAEAEKLKRTTSRSSSHQRTAQSFIRRGTHSSAFRSRIHMPQLLRRALRWIRIQLPQLDPKDLLPLGINVECGAIIIGNPSTPSLLVAEFRQSVGSYGILPAKSKYDLYRQNLNLRFHQPLIQLVRNDDYVDQMSTIGSLIHNRIKHSSAQQVPERPIFYQSYRSFLKLFRQIFLYDLTLEYFSTRRSQRKARRRSTGPSTDGAGRKVDEGTPIGIDFAAFEYAVDGKILEASSLDLTYYVDVAGLVPQETTTRGMGTGIYDIGNGDSPPEWGFDLVIDGGSFRYGPWADRQRAALQTVLFPSTYQNLDVHEQLHPGDTRVWTALQVFVEFRGATSLHIPFREGSKDWQWDGKADIPNLPKTREAASLNVAVGESSSLSYVIPMVVGPHGYESTLEVHLDSVVLTSSLNDIQIIAAESCRVRCAMPTPLFWNEERTWTFAVSLRQPLLYILRDHINMFTDLLKDWISGPPTDYQKFVPMVYLFHLELHHFQIMLYVNDQNIIDKPLNKDENAFVILEGSHIRSEVHVPSNVYRPDSSSISFNTFSPGLSLNMSLPRWNTHAMHMSRSGTSIAKIGPVQLSGSYSYYSEVRPDLIEQLKLDIKITNAVFVSYGWVIRYLMVLRDNYLGSFTHFQTLHEYLEKRRRKEPVGDPISSKYRPGKHNDLQVELFLQAESPTILLPKNFLGSTSNTESVLAGDSLCLSTPEMQLHLRLHDYYLDMSLNIDRVQAGFSEMDTRSLALSPGKRRMVMSIDGLDITANRLFGPKPRTATYLCIWEIRVGSVKTMMTIADLNRLLPISDAFRLNFIDVLNAPANDFALSVDPDVTFYKVAVQELTLTLKSGSAAVVVRLARGLKIDLNDLGTQLYSKITSLKVPSISVHTLLTSPAGRNVWLEALYIHSSIYVDIYSVPHDHCLTTRAQRIFIEEQDRPTMRAQQIFDALNSGSTSGSGSGLDHHKAGLFLPQPIVPKPTTRLIPPTIPAVRQHTSQSHNPFLWRLSSTHHMSDSEGEERVSEADRDARLAKTRLPTPRIEDAIDDELGMSSGDESDNADLTEGGSSEDEWSSTEEASQKMPKLGTLLSFYSPFVAHYSLNWFDDPRTWGCEPWSQVKGMPSFLPSHAPPADVRMSSLRPHPLCKVAAGVSNTIIRALFPESIQIFGSPLIIPAASAFKESYEQEATDPGVFLDALLSEQISEVTSSKSQSNITFDVDVNSVSFSLLHHIILSEKGRPKVSRSFKETKDPSKVDIAGVIGLSLQQLRISGVTGQKAPEICFHVSAWKGSFNKLVDKSNYRPLLGPCLLEICTSGVLLTKDSRSIAVQADEILLNTIHEAPEMVVAASLSIGLSGKRLFNMLRDSASVAFETKRKAMVNILKATQQQPSVDPLSVVQPSYLVGSGYPHMLRTSIPFKLLFHLRNSLWNSKGLGSNHLDHDLQDTPLALLQNLLQDRLNTLDQDTFDIPHLGVINPLLTESGSEEGSLQPLQVYNVQLNSVRAVVSDPRGGFSSELQFGHFLLKINAKGHELIQMPLNSSSASQHSLRSRSSREVQQFLVNISLGGSTLTLAPHLMLFIQHVLHVKRQFSTPSMESKEARARRDTGKTSGFLSPITSLHVMARVQSLQIKAAAENLLLVLGVESFYASSACLLLQNEVLSASLNLGFKEFYLQARSPRDFEKQTDQDILAAVAFLNGVISAAAKPEPGSTGNLKLLLSSNTFQIHVPRSALRLYRFVEEWRADYLPGLEAAINTLLSEYNAGPQKAASPTSSRKTRKAPEIQLHLDVPNAQILLQVMHGTWLSFEIQNTLAYAHSLKALLHGFSYAFGVQNTSISLKISSTQDTASASKVKVTLPPFSLTGSSNGFHIQSSVLFEFIDLRVKPSHWDTILAVQQKFGQDFNDLLTLIQRTRAKTISTPRAPSKNGRNIHFRLHLKMQGFRLGLMGVPCALYLECQDINGNISNENGWVWDVALSDLALSLTPKNAQLQGKSFSRNHRSAFVVLDFRIRGANTAMEERLLEFHISKTQAVMQPSSVGELGDFIDNLQAEMLEREEQRAADLADFKEKTQKILETFDVNISDVQLEQASWVNMHTIKVLIQNIGIAFPLTHSEELELPQKLSKPSQAVRAFLFTIKSVEFGVQRGQTGKASVRSLCFQFVPRFRQSLGDDFNADKHHTLNRLLYPEMKAHLRSSLSASSRKIWVEANVSGFVLDIDSSIPSYIFALIDVYRHGKERVERLSSNAPKTPMAVRTPDRPALHPDKESMSLPASNIFSKLIFMSGKVRLYSTSAMTALKTKSSLNPAIDFSDQQLLNAGVQVFNLPVVSVWAEYRVVPAIQRVSKSVDQEPSIMLFQSTIHSSQNVLSPSLLPFVTEVVHHVETRMRKISNRYNPPASTAPISSTPHTSQGDESESMTSMQITFSLRIDKSKLELTCQPDVNVIAGVHWESGGFMINIAPGLRQISFSGSVAGLTVGLKHGFLSEDCLKVDMRNLGFSVSFTRTGSIDGVLSSLVTVILDTELLGVIRFSRLQDVLCFKAVWLDRIPVLNSQTHPDALRTTLPSTGDETIPPVVSTLVLMRIREIKLNVDLGQSISSINLELSQTVFRTRLTEDLKEVFLYVADLTMSASGNISGNVRVPSCVFQTIRRSEASLMTHRDEKKTLELRLTSGALIAVIESDQQKLLHYRAEPLEVEISDDWSTADSGTLDASRPLQLSFTVNSPEIVAVVTIGTIPKMLSYINKFKANLDSQRQGAAKESTAFRITRIPKPENPLSTVAEAMLHSARAKFRESESGTSFAITQHMSLRLDLLRLIVFPRSIRDGEVAQFTGRQVSARLDRIGGDVLGAKRDIHLSFSSMTISKHSQIAHVPAYPLKPLDGSDGQEWLRLMFKDATEAIIVGLPAMQMYMLSEESIEDRDRVISYDFHSQFIRRDGMREFEDIYITLNMSLYTWLTLLRKNLTREMDQVRAAEDWRVSLLNAPVASQSSSHAQRKKKVPDPLSLQAMNSHLAPPIGTDTASPSTSPSYTVGTGGLQGSSLPPLLHFPGKDQGAMTVQGPKTRPNTIYRPRTRYIERLTMRQLGEATPDVMHPFFMKKAGFNLEDSLPQYVNEYAAVPLEEIMDILLKLYSRQLLPGGRSPGA
ncbi:hypothetical protein CVT24_009409 [Panaeolus cyanescens]|uniref:Csf1 N-terminal domain-containing protein n=1 Tax=Panaeolus cyanescens TaxID=181874 RepID=A0A409VE95_9AGAR|nr:hypothetical protein CVT24_009409 [Panaeolus cyanescens]